MIKNIFVIGVDFQVSENIVQYVAAACNGDTDAMAKLYSKTLKASYFLADTLTAGDGSAAEITKKAYAKAFCSIDKLKRPEAFEIWMKQNVALVYKETQKFVFGDAEAGTADNSSDFLPESVLSDRDSCVKILEAVAALKPVLRTAIVLHYNNGMPVAALAKFLGVSESTANALLGKARAEILNYCSLSSGVAEQVKSLPVLTRIFQFKAVDTSIENTAVRDIFIYAIDAFEASKPAAHAVEETAEAVAETEAEAATVQEAEETAPEVTEKTEEPAAEESNIISFKQKINEILDSGKTTEENAFTVEEETVKEEEEIDIPTFTVSDTAPSVSDETLDNFAAPAAEIQQQPEKKAKPALKIPNLKINPKILGIAGAVLVILIIVIAVAAGRNNEPDVGTSDAGNVGATTQVQAVNAEGYKWVEGGFSECEEIVYLDENCCYFKSKTTGKYGLMDYQGNVILQPYYDGFDRCSSGRDYSGRDSYHSLVKHGNESYEFTIENGVVNLSQTPHSAHSIDTDSMGEDVSYDERDRYFEGYAAARKDDKWGYVRQEDDKRVIKYEYEAVNELQLGAAAACDFCRPVTNGLVAVKKDGKMGIVNLKNKEVVPFNYDNIMPGKDFVFIACKDGVWGVILVGDAVASFKGVNINVIEQESTNIAENPDEAILGKYKVTSDDGANIRDAANADGELVGELSYGDVVIGYSTKTAKNGKEWLGIKHDGKIAWVSMINLELVEE